MTWANQIRILKQNFQELASVIGGTLINALKPLVSAFNAAMSHIIAFAKTISNALGKIFGWKYVESGGGVTMEDDFGGAADAADDLAGSTGEVADNVEKIQKGIRAFDELNVINLPEDNDNDNGGGGGGGAGGGGGGSAAGGDWVKGDSILKDFESEIDTLYELGEYIGEVLTNALNSIDWDKVYQGARNFGTGLANFLNGLISPDLFSALGRTIAGCLNTALHFLDSFGEQFDWVDFGTSIAAGINAALGAIDWETALSAAKNWGTGIANAINAFIRRTDFSLVGETVANALNTKIQFFLDMGTTLDFSAFGRAIGDAVNGFFKNFDFGGLGKTISTWAKGLLDTIISFLEKVDWSLVGKRIGEFLVSLDFVGIGKKVARAIWDAISAGLEVVVGSFKVAPLETLISLLFTVPKALKLIGKSKIAQDIWKVAEAVLGIGTNAESTTESLDDVDAETSGLSDEIFPALKTAIDKVKGAFGDFKTNMQNNGFWSAVKTSVTNLGSSFSDLWTNIKNGVDNARNNMSLLQSGVLGAVAAFGEFTFVSDGFEDITTKSGSLIGNLAEIATSAGVASAALYAAFGPAGLVIGALTGVVAAIKGVNDGFNELRQQRVGEYIANELSNPGGTPIEEVTDHVADSIREVGHSFDSINQGASSLEQSRGDIQATWTEIDRIKISMDEGVISTEEGTARLEQCFSELSTNVSTSLSTLETGIIGAFSEGSVISNAFEALGVDVSNVGATVVKVNADFQQSYNEAMEACLKDPGDPVALQRVRELSGGVGELDAAVSNFDMNMDAIEIDYSNVFGDGGTVNNDFLLGILDETTSAISDAKDDITLGFANLNTELLTELDKAIKNGDTASAQEIQGRLDALPAAMDVVKGEVELKGVELANTMQEDVVNGITGVLDRAKTDWSKMDWTEQIKYMFNFSNYAQEIVNDYKTNVVDPFSQGVEESFSQIGIDGAGWADEAMTQIMDSGFGVVRQLGPVKEIEMAEDFQGIVTGAIESAKPPITESAMAAGQAADDGLVSGTANGAEAAKGQMATNMTNTATGATEMSKEQILSSLQSYGTGMYDDINQSLATNAASASATASDTISNMGNQSLDDAKGKTESKADEYGKDLTSKAADGTGKDISGATSKASGNLETFTNTAVDDASTSVIPHLEKFAEDLYGGIDSGLEQGKGSAITDWSGKIEDTSKSALDTAGKNVESYAQTAGGDIVKGYNSGISNNDNSTYEEITTWQNGVKNSIHNGAMKFGSPSKTAQEFGKGVIDGFNNGIKNNTQSSKTAIDTWMNAIKNMSHSTLTDKGREMATEMIDNFKNAISSNQSGAFQSVQTMVDGIKSRCDNLNLYSSGVNAMQGFYNGLSSKAGDIYSLASTIASNVSTTINSSLKVGSPSKVLYQTGQFAMEGLQYGMEDNYSTILSSLGKFSGKLTLASAPDLSEGIAERQKAAEAAQLKQQIRTQAATQSRDADSRMASGVAETNSLLRELIGAVREGQTIEVNGKEIGKAVRKEANDYFMRTGNPYFSY